MKPTGTFANIAPGRGGIDRDPQTLASHRFPGAQPDLLRQCLQVAGEVNADATGARVTVIIKAERVGHRVPTGFIDRNLVLVVDGLDSSGKPIEMVSGPTLPSLAGPRFAGRPGRIYAKRLIAPDRPGPIAFWQPHQRLEDSRLKPGQAKQITWRFGGGLNRVRIRLFYRRFWQEVANSKRWPDNEIVVVDRTWRSRATASSGN
jgi:hypothetical protein